MAKLTMTLDTETQEMDISVDGESLPSGNVSEIAISNWGSDTEPRFSFYVTSHEKVGDVHKLTRLMAKESPEAAAALADGQRVTASSKIPGFVETPGKTKAAKQIEAWFQSTRGQK